MNPLSGGDAPARVRVCVSLPFARQMMTGTMDYFGGAELRGATFAFGLATDPSLDVHVVVLGDMQAPIVRRDGITVHFRPSVPFVEGAHDDAERSVWAAVDADVYVAFGANDATAELARFCRAHGSAFVLSIASDAAFDDIVYEGSTRRDPYDVCAHYLWYAMAHAHQVVVQTNYQQAAFRRKFARDATLIRNPAPSRAFAAPRTAPQFGGRLLWIGRIDPNKRYDEALLLASALPHRPMLMVCNNIVSLGADTIAQLEAALPNLMLADQVALPDVDALYRFADVLVNTSVLEGFPNAFLQAGSHGIPVVSMAVDPDGMLSQHGCGRVADGTRAGLAQAVEALLTDRTAYAAAAVANARWVRERHNAADRIAELNAVVRAAAVRRHGQSVIPEQLVRSA
jgi:glycosyltransferase involved in cell wall biosynthesis